jgi:hypothetical protein
MELTLRIWGTELTLTIGPSSTEEAGSGAGSADVSQAAPFPLGFYAEPAPDRYPFTEED